jgi:uracil-DNA glycosylase
MSNNKLAKFLTDTLPPGSPILFNPWRDRCTDDKPCNGPDAKLARLAAHLACNPKFILCGEAPSYRGCRHSGIAFTSEHQLLHGIPFHGKIPRIPPTSCRLTSRAKPYSERSATVVWDELYKLRIEKRTILWNAIQMHPHELGKPHSNRTPTSKEIKKGKTALERLVREFPSAKVIAVGRKAEKSLKSMGVCAEYVRHPAHGGETKFRQKLKRLVNG